MALEGGAHDCIASPHGCKHYHHGELALNKPDGKMSLVSTELQSPMPAFPFTPHPPPHPHPQHSYLHTHVTDMREHTCPKLGVQLQSMYMCAHMCVTAVRAHSVQRYMMYVLSVCVLVI